MSKQKTRMALPILGVVFVAALVAMVMALRAPQTPEFVPPAFESAAVTGVPQVEAERGYSELYREGMAYRVSVCGVPAVEGNNLTVYFTNAAGNEANLKLRVLDEDGQILGETGLLKPNEYVKTVTLNRTVVDGEKVKLKVMGYEPETYESVGSVTMTVQCAAVA